jgi:hypothetical protein
LGRGSGIVLSTGYVDIWSSLVEVGGLCARRRESVKEKKYNR